MTRPATSVMRYAQFFRLARVRSVLDYGAGLLRNSLYLAGAGFEVYAADVPGQVKVLCTHPEAGQLAGILTADELQEARLGVDLVISTFVFNIIETKAQREQYLQNVKLNLRPGGFFLIEVNSRHGDETADSARQLCQNCNGNANGYTHSEMDRLLALYSFDRICHYYSSHALAAIYRKE